jgi:hypothetical protein
MVTESKMNVKLKETSKCEVVVRSVAAFSKDRKDAAPTSESIHFRLHITYNNHTPELETIVLASLLQGSRGQLRQDARADEL